MEKDEYPKPDPHRSRTFENVMSVVIGLVAFVFLFLAAEHFLGG